MGEKQLNVFCGVGGKMRSKERFGELLWKDCWRFFFFKMLYILPKMLCQLYVTSDSECYIFPSGCAKVQFLLKLLECCCQLSCTPGWVGALVSPSFPLRCSCSVTSAVTAGFVTA